MNKIYIIWIGWIWISAIARYYNEIWYQVFWSDKTDSPLIQKLISEWIDIIIWERPEFIETLLTSPSPLTGEGVRGWGLIIYTEAIPENQNEFKRAKELWIKTLTYPQAVWEIANDKKFITISWSHWKSTTTSLASLMFKNTDKNFTSIVWTLLKEFDWKNYYSSNSPSSLNRRKELEDESAENNTSSLKTRKINKNKDSNNYFIIEACEYKRSFLNYKPDIAIITNIEIDHLDYYKNKEDYVSAFRQLVDNIKTWWYVILSWQDENSKSLIWQRQDVNYIIVYNDYFIKNWQKINFPKIKLNIPWEHIVYDAKLVYILWIIVWIEEKFIIDTFKNYNWVWRRMEILWKTKNNNIVISDYWHHPTEVKLTLKAIKDKYIDSQILTVFQPHQYNRTIELLTNFIDSFIDTDKLIIPNIYESRDTEKDKQKMNAKIFVEKINHPNKLNWHWLENTLKLIEEFDEKNLNSVIVLMWAGDIDNLRYKIIDKKPNNFL